MLSIIPVPIPSCAGNFCERAATHIVVDDDGLTVGWFCWPHAQKVVESADAELAGGAT